MNTTSQEMFSNLFISLKVFKVSYNVLTASLAEGTAGQPNCSSKDYNLQHLILMQFLW